MKTKLRFLTEEGRTRSKNAFRRFCAYAVVMFLVAGAGAYVIHRYWVTINLTVMQRVYFKQYFKSTWRGTFANSRSQYTTLARTVIDPNTKKEVSLYVKDDEIAVEAIAQSQSSRDQSVTNGKPVADQIAVSG